MTFTEEFNVIMSEWGHSLFSRPRPLRKGSAAMTFTEASNVMMSEGGRGIPSPPVLFP